MRNLLMQEAPSLMINFHGATEWAGVGRLWDLNSQGFGAHAEVRAQTCYIP